MGHASLDGTEAPAERCSLGASRARRPSKTFPDSMARGYTASAWGVVTCYAAAQRRPIRLSGSFPDGWLPRPKSVVTCYAGALPSLSRPVPHVRFCSCGKARSVARWCACAFRATHIGQLAHQPESLPPLHGRAAPRLHLPALIGLPLPHFGGRSSPGTPPPLDPATGAFAPSGANVVTCYTSASRRRRVRLRPLRAGVVTCYATPLRPRHCPPP